MLTKPVVFISATSDLRSARDLVGKVLYSMGYEPVWQDIEPTDGGELLAVLRKRLEPCSLVVQLVGSRYGAEPPTPTAEFGRISYTQFEAVHAEKLGTKVVYHFLDPSFPTDPVSPESDECKDLQVAYQQRIIDANKLRHTHINSTVDLELSIRRLSDELAAVRKQSDRRFRKLLWLVGSAVAGVAIVAVLVLAVLHHLKKTDEQFVVDTSQMKDALSALRNEVRAAVTPKLLPHGQNAPDALSPAVMEKAKILLERGNAEDQALAKIALGQHAEADRIIQDLKSKPGNPIDEAFRLLTLEGDNWYSAGEIDKAVEPYEQALALRPADVTARNNATVVHASARLGSIATHRRRAIEVGEGTLKLVPAGSAAWAMTEMNLGGAWSELPTGDRDENLRKAIAAFGAALTVFARDTDPTDWAKTQNNIGAAWFTMPTGDRGENLRKSIAAFEAALTVFTGDADPTKWATTQNNLGSAWSDLKTGDRSENLRKAIAAYEAALTVRTKAAAPTNWAMTQNNLGVAWHTMPTGDRGENLRKSIAAFEAALTVFTKDTDPSMWAVTQNNLANAWSDLTAGNRGENLRKAIAAYEAALTVHTKEAEPTYWAGTQNNLGLAWTDMPTGDRGENLRKALAAFDAALTVSTRDADPTRWAMTESNLALACGNMAALKGEDRIAWLGRAIVCDEAALLVYTAERYPREHADVEKNLRIFRQAYEAAGGAATRPFDQIPPTE